MLHNIRHTCQESVWHKYLLFMSGTWCHQHARKKGQCAVQLDTDNRVQALEECCKPQCKCPLQGISHKADAPPACVQDGEHIPCIMQILLTSAKLLTAPQSLASRFMCPVMIRLSPISVADTSSVLVYPGVFTTTLCASGVSCNNVQPLFESWNKFCRARDVWLDLLPTTQLSSWQPWN